MKSDLKKKKKLAENAASQLSEPISIKLCRQQVVSHHAFDCARLHNPMQPPRCRKSFLAHVSMTSEQGRRNSDTFYLFILKDVYGNYYLFVFLFIFLFCYYYY